MRLEKAQGRMLSAPGHLSFAVVDVGGDVVLVEIAFHRDTVEVFCLSRNRAVFDREVLRAWLAEPEGWLTEDDVSWRDDEGELQILIEPVVAWWPVGWVVGAGLRERV